MAYPDDEASAELGEPVEIYTFTSPIATYRYTSGVASVVYSGDTYTPAAGLRRAVQPSPDATSGRDLEVTIGSGTAVAMACAFDASPNSMRLTVRRVQVNSGEAALIWDGVIVGAETTGIMTTLRSSSQVGQRLSMQVPALSIQGRCPHVLYGDRCRADRASFAHTTSISSISASTVTVAGVGGNPDQWFANGAEIEHTSTGERRIVYDQTGTVLTLASAFTSAVPGDAVTMWAGCDHVHRFHTDAFGVPVVNGDCFYKFNNVVNFGGHASVPNSNPFTLNVRLTRGSD